MTRMMTVKRRKDVNADSILGLAVSALLLVYLAYALLHPEKF